MNKTLNETFVSKNTGVKITNDDFIIQRPKKVVIIPATKSLHPERDGVKPIRDKVRVAAYCRVSTAQEEQQGSFALQRSYYEKFIANNPSWELVQIYGDEGKSGTSLKGRTGFLAMMDDVRAGMIDMIITKATSRFGRNNAEFIQVLDELDEYGVEVLFESEGIVTSGTQNRTMLQVMGASNEHYSNTLSNNVRWSKERNMRQGKVTISYKTFLGYEKGPDGNPVIIPEEAETVRAIFSLFLSGMSYGSIAKKLNSESITTKNGKAWTSESVKRILTNEKYTGDVLLQKTYKKSYLDKASKKNNGEKPMVLVENNHPAIIDRTTFAKAKELMAERKKKKHYGTATNPFIGKVVCSECNNFYGHRIWNSRGNIKYDMWVCTHKYTEETVYSDNKCRSANLRQEWLERGYLVALGQLLADTARINAKYARKLARIDQQLNGSKKTDSLDDQIKKAAAEIREIEGRRLNTEREYELSFGRNSEFANKKHQLKVAAQAAITKKQALEAQRDNLRARQKELISFLSTIKTITPSILNHTGFIDSTVPIFLNTIDHITVTDQTITYHFYGDESVRLNIKDLK